MSVPDIIDVEPVEDGEVTVANLPARYEGALIQPAASVDDIAQAFKAYQELRTKLLDPAKDFQEIWGGGSFVKRSGWRKLSTAFGVSMEIVEQEESRDERGMLTLSRCHVRATAPNGRIMDGWGACDVYERCCEPNCPKRGKHNHCPGKDGWHAHADAWTHFSKVEHDVPATAETRAKNRAAADLFGMGELSAEELDPEREGDDEEHPPPRHATTSGGMPVCANCGGSLAGGAKVKLDGGRRIHADGCPKSTERKEAPTDQREEDGARDRSGAEDHQANGGAGAPPSAITAPQRARIMATLGGLDRDERLARLSTIVGRPLGSTNELTKDEAGAAIDALERGE
jgi:hypothetical protein